jgi:hypothetical protein
LQDAVKIAVQLRSESTKPRIHVLLDWTARVCNACDADTNLIAAYYSVLLASLASLAPELMSTVKMISQSEAILSDPSNYWISVINVGHHFMRNEVMGSDMKDLDGVGIIIGSLMRVADALGFDPSSVALADSPEATVEASLIENFYKEKLEGMVAPAIHHVNGPSMSLQPKREKEADKTENDEYYLLDDRKVSRCCASSHCFVSYHILCFVDVGFLVSPMWSRFMVNPT